MLQVAEERDGRQGLAGNRYLTADERRARGKALRQRAPRQDHGAWEPPEGRRDPVDLSSESNEDTQDYVHGPWRGRMPGRATPR
jgi:hypothetical protein